MTISKTLPIKYKYAEEWLNQAVDELRVFFAKHGHVVPEVLISVGFTHKGYNPKRKCNNFDGFCMSRHMSKANIHEIYIAPYIEDGIDMIFLIAHELIHAVDNCYSGHGDRFKSIARDLGMPEGGVISKAQYVETYFEFKDIHKRIGRYPRLGVTYEHTLTPINPNALEERLDYRTWKSNKGKS